MMLCFFQPSALSTSNNYFHKLHWSYYNFRSIVKSKREVHPRALVPRGIGFTIVGKAVADHAADEITRSSRAGFITCLNSTPFYWFLKTQTSAETSSFGSEFMAMRQLCECLRGPRYKF